MSTSRVNITPALGKFKRVQATAQSEIITILPRIGRLVAVQLAQKTQPAGFSAASRKKGENAVASQIRQVYATGEDVWATIADKKIAGLFLSHLRRRQVAKAKAIMDAHSSIFAGVRIGAFDGGALHKKLRRRGRISRSQKPQLVVQTNRDLKAYIAAEKRMVGFLKGGWAECAGSPDFGGSTRGIPQWVTRHLGKVKARTFIDVRNRERPRVGMTNQISYAGEEIEMATRRAAETEGKRRLFEALAREYRQALRKAA